MQPLFCKLLLDIDVVLRHFIILVASLSLNCSVFCQHSWRIDKLGVADGLSQGHVYAIHQDKKGFIWIGTHGGLNRYDGYRFKVFRYSPFNASTLGDNSVFFLKEDTVTGKFWIGGSSSLNEFDPKTFVNTRYRYPKKQMEFSDGIFVNSHELLLACEYAVLLFDTRKKTFLEIPVMDEDNNPISINRVENTAADKIGNVMIMSSTGVFFYDSTSRSCKRKTATSPDFSSFNNYEVFNVLHDTRGYYWIATNKKGLMRLDHVSKKSAVIPLPLSLTNESIRFDIAMEDSHGNIWAASSKGLFRIDPSTLQSEHFSANLSSNEINAIIEDRNHFLWIGTVGGGINKMVPRNPGFKNFPLAGYSGGTAAGSYIMALQQLGNDLWFTNIWDQVGKIDRQTSSTQVMSRPEGYSWYSEGTIVKTNEDELSVLNGENLYRFKVDASGKISVQPQHTPGLHYIYHSKKSGESWPMVKVPADRTFLRNDTIYGNQFFYDALEDEEGNLWIGSSKGLIEFNPSNNVFTHYQHDESNRNSISSNFIYALEMDDDNRNIWMAAYNGSVCSYDIKSKEFKHYSREDGLSDNTVTSVEKDHHGNLWFSTLSGISAYNSDTKTFRNYTVADGLLNQEFNRRSSFKNSEGWLFFGGVSGIDYFHPDSIVENKIRSSLAFTSFRVFNTDYFPDKHNTDPVIELQPDGRDITVEFASLDFGDQQKIQYAYRISDNPEWIGIGNLNILSFSGLSTGSHQLFVRSTNGEGTWLDNEIACLIMVNPWWWETWWFRIGVGLLGIGVLFSAIRFYYRRKMERQKIILERQQAIEKERTRIATDMHDDLGANLSRIKFLSETIGIKKQKQETIENEINSIRDYSHDMIDKMGEIVWALNEKNDSLSDLLAYTRSYSVEYLSQNNIQTEVQTPENIPNQFLSGEFRRNVYLTVKEALHNIVKHSEADKVAIRVETGEQLFISIHDNGKGFDEGNIRPFSNGISNMKKRIKNLGGNLEIRNTSGSTIILSVPLT